MVIVSLYTPDIREYAEPVVNDKLAYAERHGYEAEIFYSVIDPARPAGWSKIQAILQSFAKHQSEWLFWTDADSVITNHQIKLESFIDERYDFIFASDVSGLNSGNFFVRKTAPAILFLKYCYEQVQYLNHGWWEQKAITEVLRGGYDIRYKLAKPRDFNSRMPGIHDLPEIADYTPYEHQAGDFMLHLSGMKTKDRMKILSTLKLNSVSGIR